MESTGIDYPLKTKIRHKTQNVNAKHSQCQCIISGRSCGPSPCIFDVISFFSGPQFEKTGFKNLEQSPYLCILWYWHVHVYTQKCFFSIWLLPSSNKKGR